jgi:hypothetical protein
MGQKGKICYTWNNDFLVRKKFNQSIVSKVEAIKDENQALDKAQVGSVM